MANMNKPPVSTKNIQQITRKVRFDQGKSSKAHD